jgi:N-acetylglucosamine-6-sulfatase
MRRFLSRHFLTLLLVGVGTVLVALAQQPAVPGGVPAQGGVAPGGRGGPAPPATVPLESARNAARHTTFLEIAKAGGIDLLFVGDSITDGWRSWGFVIWRKNFAALNAANFGIGGDTTQGVLWRMQNGELEGFKAKLIVLMLGTNNINRNPNADIAEGNRLIVEEFRKRQPQAKVLILGIFPRGVEAANPYRASIKEINGMLAKLADDKQVFYMDIGEKFLTPDGTLTAEIMPDALHPHEAGYQIWADAIAERVAALMK